MPTRIALVRGVNVGGAKLLMADLRKVMALLGHTDVVTYIQSGNVVFSPAAAGPDDPAALAAGIEGAIADAAGIRPAVVVLTAAELAGVVAGNPYPDETDPRRVHVVFLPAEPGPEAPERIAGLRDRAAQRGGRDEAVLAGRALYLHTPDGFGRSELANLLLASPASPAAGGTARNWGTVTRLLALCGR